MVVKATRKLPDDGKIGRQVRFFALERAGVDVEARTVPVSFSSEVEVERWWGNEILGHDAGEIDLGWLETGRAPVLVDHNPRDPVGVVMTPSIGADRKGRAVLKFGNSARANEIFQDVQDGIRSSISVGYEIRDLVPVALEGDPADDADPTYRATNWAPLEISIVSIPADMSVGVGRSETETNVKPTTLKQRENQTMKTQAQIDAEAAAAATAAAAALDTNAVRVQVLKDRNAEAGEILAIGKRFGMIDQAQKALSEGSSLDAFRKLVLDAQTEANIRGASTTAPATELGLTGKEVKQFSMLRAINAIAEKDWSLAGFERECSLAIEKKLGAASRGFYVPFDVLVAEGFLRDNPKLQQQRDMTVGTVANGGYLVATNLLAGSFIEILRNRTAVTRMGARMLPGLVGNVAIPRQITAATTAWLAEQGTVSGSTPTLNQVTLSPKTIGGKTIVSRTLRMQSTPAADGLVRDDLSQVIALGVDSAALNGTGASNQPTGIRNLAGISVTALGTNGLAITYAGLVALETAVATANADVGALGYITNAKQRGASKQIARFANTDTPLWGANAEMGAGFGMVNGYNAICSNQAPSNLTKGTASGICSNWTFGNFNELLIGMWGVLDIQVDPYSSGDAGDTIVRAFQSADIAARHTTSFAIIEDAL